MLVFNVDVVRNHFEKNLLYINYFSFEGINFIIILKSLTERNKVPCDKICFKFLLTSLLKY